MRARTGALHARFDEVPLDFMRNRQDGKGGAHPPGARARRWAGDRAFRSHHHSASAEDAKPRRVQRVRRIFPGNPSSWSGQAVVGEGGRGEGKGSCVPEAAGGRCFQKEDHPELLKGQIR